MDSTLLLQAKQLSCLRNERQLFDCLNFSIHSGQLLQITGANGSGKTTLMRFIAGLGQVVDGHLLAGARLSEESQIDRSKVLYFGHIPAISLRLTVIENLRFLAQQSMIDASEHQCLQALKQVGLLAFSDYFAAELSAGQKRRIALAKLFLPQAHIKLWLLDEPFTALDVPAQAQLEQHIIKFSKSGGAVLFITHHQLSYPHIDTLKLGERNVADA